MSGVSGMAMLHIIVCIKQVPSTNDLKIDPVDYTLVRDGVNQILNPAGESALEIAFSIKDKIKSEITALSMGKISAKSILWEALKLGADKAVLINDKSYAGSDTYATSIILCGAIRHIGKSDLIVCGNRTLDGETGQVGPELATKLIIPCVTNVTSLLEANESNLKIKKQTDKGYEILEVSLPALICVNEGSACLRPPGIMSIRASRDKKVLTFDNNILNIDKSLIGIEGSPTRVRKAYVPKMERKKLNLKEDSPESRKELIGLIEEMIKN